MSARLRFWTVTAATVFTVGVTASLGVWQMGRAAQKENLAAQIAQRQTLPSIDNASLVKAGTDAQALLHRTVHLRGRWVASASVFLDNRPMAGRSGFLLVTPLRLSGSEATVLVQRGWLPRDFQDRSRLPLVDTPTDEVELMGRLSTPPSRLFELGGAEQGPIRQNLDLAELSRQTGLSLLPLSVLQTGASAEGMLREWPRFNATQHKHHGYAAQWFAMSVLAAGLYVWFQWISPRRQRKHHEQDPR